ncbi:MAG: spore coat associated protein CotJA [Oscillospiraceae bacterium]|nr:spore coat associated protein CotJA [Oscillospiraceae bacterium]
MDGSKNAMYVQAGRSMSRSRVTERPAARAAESKPVAMAAPQFATVPATNTIPVREPVMIPARISALEPSPAPASVPVQEPVSAPVPAQGLAPAVMPEPARAHVPSPAPVQEPVSAPVPAQGLTPAVMPEPARAHVPSPAPVPVPMIEPAAAEMEIVLPPLPSLPVIPPPVTESDGCSLLAMAFMEIQEWQGLYEPEHGFSRGTIFEDLDLPFMGEGACRRE